MNSNKNYLRLLTAITAAILSMSITSCGDDGESDGENGSRNNLIQTLTSNKWIARDASYGEGTNGHAWVDIETWLLYFTNNNTGTSYWIQKDYDTNLGSNTRREYTFFTYTVSGNLVTITYEDNIVSRFIYKNGLLTSESGGTIFDSSPMTSNDYSLVKSLAPKTGSCGSNLKYTFDDRNGKLIISGSGRMNDYTASSQPWHDYSISKIIIEDGCTYVGSHAFHNLKHVVSEVDLANSIQEIGDYAFCDLMVSEISIPVKTVKIGNYAFSDCTLLKSVNFRGCDALEEIGDHAFAFCPIKMGYFTFPPNVKKLGSQAFMSSSFSSLTLNDKVESIGNGCFANLNVSKIEIPNSVKYVGAQAFRGTFSEIRIGTGLSSMGEIPFVSNKIGKMYVNLGNPISFSNATYMYVVGNTLGDNAASSWTLYVPKGSKSAYQKATGWKSFKSIIEDASLVSGNGMPQSDDDNQDDDNDNQDDDNDNQDDVEKDTDGVPVTYQYPIIYYIDNKKFKTVLVEDGPYGDFYMMQTEFPASGEAYLFVDTYLDTYGSGTPDDGNIGYYDGLMTKYELREFLEDLRKNTGIPFRLPTKDEWQYAAKGGNKSRGFTYSGSNYIDEVAWYSGNSENLFHAPAMKSPNELGLYDMCGNFDELCSETTRYSINHAKNYNTWLSVDGPMCGGNWQDAASSCTVDSWKEGSTRGNIGLTGVSEKNAVSATHLSLRLVYSKTIK